MLQKAEGEAPRTPGTPGQAVTLSILILAHEQCIQQVLALCHTSLPFGSLLSASVSDQAVDHLRLQVAGRPAVSQLA